MMFSEVKTVSSKVAASDKTPGPDEAIHIWPEFEGFQHQIEFSRQREVVYWHHRTRTSLFHRGLEHAIAFVHADGNQPDPSRLNGEVFTASLVCTNRMLPASLHTGDICVPVNKIQRWHRSATLRARPVPLYPVTDGDMHWSLISCMNLNYLSLLDRGADPGVAYLRYAGYPPSTAGTAFLTEARCHRKMESRPVDRLFKGVPVRGLSTTLWINPAPLSVKARSTCWVPYCHTFCAVRQHQLISLSQNY